MNLKTLGACNEGIEFAEGFKTLQEAWDACERGDWMLWLLGRLSGPPESESRKHLVLIACRCARLSLKYIPKGENRPLKAIQAAEKWAKGKATIAAVHSAANAAYAASLAANAAYAASLAANAANAAYAAYAASLAAHAAYASAAAASAAYAASVAANAANAAYAANVTRAKTLKQCAEIVRKMCPKAPRLIMKGE